jgi:hypothetical protein
VRGIDDYDDYRDVWSPFFGPAGDVVAVGGQRVAQVLGGAEIAGGAIALAQKRVSNRTYF